MIKMMGIILLIFAGATGGAAASDRLKKRCDTCKMLIGAAGQMALLIRYKSMTFYEIAGELQLSQSFSESAFINALPKKYDGESGFSKLWIKALDIDTDIGKEEKDLLRSFAANLGASDTQGQLSELELLIHRLETVQERRYEIYSKKGRLYRSIGLLAGVMAGIMAV